MIGIGHEELAIITLEEEVCVTAGQEPGGRDMPRGRSEGSLVAGEDPRLPDRCPHPRQRALKGLERLYARPAADDIEQIRYYDELLTMSARLAAATGDMSYVQRYRDAVPKLNLVIADAFTLVPDATARTAVSETDAANRALVALEESSFSLLAAGDRQAACDQLTSGRYVELKTAYAQGMQAALSLLEEADKAATNRSNRRQTGSLVAGGLAVAVLGLMWFRTSVGLNRSRGRLQRSGESKDEFLAGVSHELRTPLTAVVGYSSILHSDWAGMDDGERQILVALIHQQSTEMAHIVEDLLVATRLDQGELTFSQLPVQLTKEIEAVLAALPVPNHSTLLVAVPDSIQVIGDSNRIRQVFRNLITNAYRYGGTSIVSTPRTSTARRSSRSPITATACRARNGSWCSNPITDPTPVRACPTRSASDSPSPASSPEKWEETSSIEEPATRVNFLFHSRRLPPSPSGPLQRQWRSRR